MQVFLILALLIAIFAVFFAIQNTAMVTVYFFVWQFSSSLALVLLFSLGIGVLLSLLFSLPALQGRNWQISKLKKKVLEVTEENNELREKNAEQLGQINALQHQFNDFKMKALQAPQKKTTEEQNEALEDNILGDKPE